MADEQVANSVRKSLAITKRGFLGLCVAYEEEARPKLRKSCSQFGPDPFMTSQPYLDTTLGKQFCVKERETRFATHFH